MDWIMIKLYQPKLLEAAIKETGCHQIIEVHRPSFHRK
jgi:hypothetical protein